MFTSEDHEKFRTLRIAHLANDELTPEQIFLTAVDDALEQRRAHRIDKLIRAARFPIPQASVAEINYQEGRGITPVRMKRYAAHQWRQDPTNLLVIARGDGIGQQKLLNELSDVDLLVIPSRDRRAKPEANL